MATQVYVYGSGECEQLGLGDDAPPEVKKARKPKFELSPGIPLLKPIIQIACGGMHTVALASNGILLSWGCNDDGALGRSGPENTPLRVDGALNIPVNGVTCGDCHTVAYNTEANKVYFWGCYKAVVSGKRSHLYEKPTRIAQEIFGAKRTKSKVKKIASGQQHTLALSTDGKVFGWGDPESGKIGRIRRGRDPDEDLAMKIESIGAKKAEDIFVGKQHSFYRNDKKQVYAWGLNNHGQLGLGSRVNIANPSRVKELDPYEGDYVTDIVGGEHHSVALTLEGAVYCFGRNDEAQMGVGNLYEEYRQAKAKEEAEKAAKMQQEQPAAPESSVPDGQPLIEEKKKKKTAIKPEKEDDLKYIAYFYRPTINHFLWKLELAEGEDPAVFQKKATKIAASGQYSYALVEGKNEVYSWGFGENYVLGTLKDQNEPEPHNVNPKMFEERKVFQIALGTQHVAALVSTEDGGAGSLPALNMSEFELAEGAFPPNEDEDKDDVSQLSGHSKKPSPNKKAAGDKAKPKESLSATKGDVATEDKAEIADKKRTAADFLQGSQPTDQEPAKRLKLDEPKDVVMANSGAGSPQKQDAVQDKPMEAPKADEVPAMQVPASNQEMAAPEDEKDQIQKEPVVQPSDVAAETEVPAKPDTDAAKEA